jgi:hypothetical protein
MNQKTKPDELLRSIYLGDRACKAVLIESWKKSVAIQVDCISFLRPGRVIWDFYTDKDVVDGWLVFDNVSRFHMEPSGPIPNDRINEITAEPIFSSTENPSYLFTLYIDSVDETGNTVETTLRIAAECIHVDQR